MPNFRDCYQTTSGQTAIIAPVVQKIKESIIKSGRAGANLNVISDDGVVPCFITGTHASEMDIPQFSHPLVVQYRDVSYVCSDMRLFVRVKESDPNHPEVRDRINYNFTISREILTMKWVSGHQTDIAYGLHFGATAFAYWISDTIKQAFALDFREQALLTAVCHLYYQTLFIDATEFDDEQRQRMAAHTIKGTKLPSEIVLEALNHFEKVTSVESLCEIIVKATGNIRLEKFNYPVLTTLLRNSWFGPNAKENIAVALEHPPTWCSIIYAALSDRTYKNSKIAQIADKYGKRGLGDEFMKAFKTMVEQMTYKHSVVAYEALVIKEFDDE